MKRKLLITLMTAGLTAGLCMTAFADEKDDRIAELEQQVTDLQATIEELEAEITELKSASPVSTDQEEYQIGDTWVVEGQWKVTVDSVEETEERNEYDDRTPGAVYIVTYTYENLGYDDEIMDGLFISLADGIVDCDGKMGYEYPGDVTMYPQETPVGATCEAQVCIGVENPGDFKINFSAYDADSVSRSAVFNIEI